MNPFIQICRIGKSTDRKQIRRWQGWAERGECLPEVYTRVSLQAGENVSEWWWWLHNTEGVQRVYILKVSVI